MTEPANIPDSNSAGADDEISVLELLVVLAKHKLLILGLPFVVAAITAGYSLTLPNIFTASTRVLAPQKSESGAAAILGQLGSIAGLVGGGGGKSTNDVYVAMLKSRTVADNLIQRFGLMQPGNEKHPSAVRAKLAGVTTIVAGRDGIISIDVDDEDPKLAAEIANAYVEELLKLTQVLAVTEASQRRLFFERQFAQAKDNLSKAEALARRGLEHGGLVKVDDQGRAMVEAIARLRGQITVKEVQVGAMRTFAAEANPDLQMVQQEIASMKKELAKLEGASGAKIGKTDLSAQGMDNLSLLRNVKYYEVIFELLARQYEIAKVDEAKESTVVQVLDKAVEPDLKSKPKRFSMVLISAFAAGAAAVILAFLREAADNARNVPQQAARLASLKAYLDPRRKAKV